MTKFNKKFDISRWTWGSIGAALLWYISLFPGRIGSDPVQAVLLMKQGNSTDWWTAIFFWFLKISTFNGQSIWLASLISITVLYIAVYFFIFSLPIKSEILNKTLFIICVTPIFGNFGVNINHDVFFSSGVLLILGISLRRFYAPDSSPNYLMCGSAIILLLNAKTGYVIIIAFLIYLFLTHFNKIAVICCGLLAAVAFLISSLGVSKSTVPIHFLPALADLKCVTQHPEARITDQEWQYLGSIAEINDWKVPKTCSNMDIAIESIRSKKLDTLNAQDFIINYFSIVTRNPAIVIQAHLQRSSQALPPPFFQGPENQVDRNIQNPVGLNTNIALQQGPSVLHPSIDYAEFKIQNGFLKTLESIALLPSFLVNQASWFWGWGGLWFWPIFLYLIFPLQLRKPMKLLHLTYPLLANHLFLVLVGPIPAPRYVMSTILTGCIMSILLIFHVLETTKRKID